VLAVVAIVALLAVVGTVLAVVFVGRAVNDAVNESAGNGSGSEALLGGGIIPGLPGGECLEFQLAYTTLTMQSFLGMGADEEQLEELEEGLSEMRSFVPSEIEDDFEVVSEAFREAMRLAIGSSLLLGEPSEEQARQAEEILESPEVVEAQENINDWLLENCS
jgi:hypothetical protein